MTIPGPKPRAFRLEDLDHALRTLDAIRDDRGISCSAIAAELPLPPDRSEVAKWLGGRRKPGAHRVFEIANALGYDLALIPRSEP